MIFGKTYILNWLSALAKSLQWVRCLALPARAVNHYPAQADLAAIQRITSSGDTLAGAALLDYFFVEDAAVRQAARAAAAQLWASLPAQKLPSFDLQIRKHSASWHLPPRWRLKAADLAELAADPHGVLLLALASSHRDGFVRQEAVRRLGAAHEISTLAALLVRMNDWVEPVRAEAKRFALALMETTHARSWVQNLPLVFRLENEARGADQLFVEAILEMLRQPACHPALREGLFHRNRQVSQACLRVIQTLPPAASAPLIKDALASSDPLLRFAATRLLMTQAASLERLEEIVSVSLCDSFMPIRRLALETALQQSLPQTSTWLKAAAVDDHASLRELARFHLQQSGGPPARSLYLALLNEATERTLAPTLLGLGESGTKNDFGRVSSFLGARKARVWQAALAAAAQLDAENAAPFLIAALLHEQPGISRQARYSLILHPKLIEAETLLAVWQSQALPHVRRNAFRILLLSDKWTLLAVLLNGLIDGDAWIQAKSQTALTNWLVHFNRSFARPTASQFHHIQSALSSAKSCLRPTVYVELRALLNRQES